MGNKQTSTVAGAAFEAANKNTAWMPKPPTDPNAPPGLEYLLMLNQIKVIQEMSVAEAITAYEDVNRYKVINAGGAQIYYAVEDSSTCCRQCCGRNRGFKINLADSNGQVAMRIVRDLNCCANCWDCCALCGCCKHKVIVEAPVGTPVATIAQNCSWCYPRYVITNMDDEEVFEISGPCRCCRCCLCCVFFEKEFTVSAQGSRVGRIVKEFSGAKEFVSDADNFRVEFPEDLDVRMKAVLLGATFMIDFMHFEEASKKEIGEDKVE